MNRRKISNAVRSLPKDLAPRRDLWPEIEVRLEAEASRGNPGRRRDSDILAAVRGGLVRLWPAAAVLAIAVVLGVVASNVGDTTWTETTMVTRSLAIRGSRDPATREVMAMLQEAEEAYRRARSQLLSAVRAIDGVGGGQGSADSVTRYLASIDLAVSQLVADAQETASPADSASRLALFLGTQATEIAQAGTFVRDMTTRIQ